MYPRFFFIPAYRFKDAFMHEQAILRGIREKTNVAYVFVVATINYIMTVAVGGLFKLDANRFRICLL